MSQLCAFFLLQIIIIPLGMWVAEEPLTGLPSSRTVGWSLVCAGIIYAACVMMWMNSSQVPDFSLPVVGMFAAVNLIVGVTILGLRSLLQRRSSL